MSMMVSSYRFASGSGVSIRGAVAYDTTANGTTFYLLEAEAYDTDSFHDLSTNTDRMTIPSGVSLVRCIGQETGTGSSSPAPEIKKNGSAFLGGALALTQDDLIGVATGPLSVTAGDYFGLAKGTLGSPDLSGGIWFAIEVLDSSTKYALVSKTSNQALSAGVTAAMAWDNEVADTNSFHDNVTNNTRLTVPSGVTRVKLVANLRSTTNVNTAYVVEITKNGASVAGGPVFSSTFTGQMNLSSALLEVTAGDYFEVSCNSVAAQTVATHNNTWFAIYEMPNVARALVKKVATQSVTSATPVALAFGSGSEVYDTNAAHDETTNNSRLTVPTGFTKAKLSFSVVTANASGVQKAIVTKNGSSPVPGLPGFNVAVSGVDYLSGEGAWIDVTPGDYFELVFTPGSNQTLPIDDRTWFAIELA